MEKNEANFRNMVSHLQKLGFEEKTSYLSQSCPPGLGAFPNQSVGQYLFSYVSAVNDKLHLNTDEKPLPEFMKEHGAAREYLLKSVVGEDCFPRYMQLEELRSKRRKEIMENTSRLYHFSQVPPAEFGAYLTPRLQVAGNALSERINEALCYAAADKESHYIVKPPSNDRKEWDGVSVYMDEKAVLIRKNFWISRNRLIVTKLTGARLSLMCRLTADLPMNTNLPKMPELSAWMALFPL